MNSLFLIPDGGEGPEDEAADLADDGDLRLGKLSGLPVKYHPCLWWDSRLVLIIGIFHRGTNHCTDRNLGIHLERNAQGAKLLAWVNK